MKKVIRSFFLTQSALRIRNARNEGVSLLDHIANLAVEIELQKDYNKNEMYPLFSAIHSEADRITVILPKQCVVFYETSLPDPGHYINDYLTADL